MAGQRRKFPSMRSNGSGSVQRIQILQQLPSMHERKHGRLSQPGQPFRTGFAPSGDRQNGRGQIGLQNLRDADVGHPLLRGEAPEPVTDARRHATRPAGPFHTNDVATVDETGHYYIKGRLNNTILGPSGENIYPEEIEQVINNIEGVEESLVMERDGKLVALVKFTDNALDWNQATEDKFFEELEARKKAILDWVNKTVGKNSKIGEVDAMKEPFEKTATQKIRRFKYKDSHGDEPEKPDSKPEEK